MNKCVFKSMCFTFKTQFYYKKNTEYHVNANFMKVLCIYYLNKITTEKLEGMYDKSRYFRRTYKTLQVYIP